MSWEPINLRHLEDRPQAKPTILGLLYPGKRHLFTGPPESAKTLAAYAAAITVARDGGTVLLIDYEMGPWDARDRLRELGVTDDDLDRILYVEPEDAADKTTCQQLIDACDPALVVVDAAAGAYSLQRLDDNKRGDVERFTETILRPFWLRGVTALVIDHVAKDSDSRGSWAIGSERKTGSVDVHIGFEAITPLSRGGAGVVRLITRRDRIGCLARPFAGELHLSSDPDTHAITWEVRPAEQTEDGKRAEFRPTLLMERVSRYLEQIAPRAASRSEIEKSVKGKDKYLRAATDVLLAEGHVEKEQHGNRQLFRSVKTYREADEHSAHGADDPLGPDSARPEAAPETNSAHSAQTRPELGPKHSAHSARTDPPVGGSSTGAESGNGAGLLSEEELRRLATEPLSSLRREFE